MMRLIGEIPKGEFYLACSGGIDSMVVLDFLLRGRHKPSAVLYFDHGTEHGKEAQTFLRQQCKALRVNLIEGAISRERNASESQEEYWRNERYDFFSNYNCVITAHHLDDVAEWWIFSSLHGGPTLIPYRRDNIIRPFLMVPKEEIKNWATKRSVKFIDDPSNQDVSYNRNYIRHIMMEHILNVNPGFRTVISKKLKEAYVSR